MPSPAELFDLTGKVAVVTGGGSGIGEAIARTLAQAGAAVAIADISVDSGNRVAKEIEAKVYEVLGLGEQDLVQPIERDEDSPPVPDIATAEPAAA